MDCSPPGSSVHGILRAKILEWTAISFSRGASRPRDRTRAAALTGGFFTTEPTREALGTKVPSVCPAPHSGNSARILLGPSVPVEVTSVARRPSLQRGSAVRGIPWFPGMSVEDSELVTGGAGSVTACSDTVPVRTAVDGPQSILGRGLPWYGCQDCLSTAGAQFRSLVGELRSLVPHGAARKTKGFWGKRLEFVSSIRSSCQMPRCPGKQCRLTLPRPPC